MHAPGCESSIQFWNLSFVNNLNCAVESPPVSSDTVRFTSSWLVLPVATVTFSGVCVEEYELTWICLSWTMLVFDCTGML